MIHKSEGLSHSETGFYNSERSTVYVILSPGEWKKYTIHVTSSSIRNVRLQVFDWIRTFAVLTQRSPSETNDEAAIIDTVLMAD